MADEREVLTWSDFGVASRVLATEIAESGFRTDIVIAVARGGLLPAGALAYALGTKAAGTLNVEFYTDVEETLPAPVVLEPMLDTAALAGKNLLVVDDVADSGKTLALVMELLIPHAASVRSAVLYTKPRTVIHPITPGGRPTCGSRSRGRPSRRSPRSARRRQATAVRIVRVLQRALGRIPDGPRDQSGDLDRTLEQSVQRGTELPDRLALAVGVEQLDRGPLLQHHDGAVRGVVDGVQLAAVLLVHAGDRRLQGGDHLVARVGTGEEVGRDDHGRRWHRS